MAAFGRCYCLISVLVPLLWATSAPAGAADYQGGVSAIVLKKTTLTGNGQKIIYPATDKAEVTAMLVDVAPGAETGWHSHPIPVYAYVVAGNLDVELVGGQNITYHAGDVIIEIHNALHNGKNRSPEKVRLVVFYTGIEGVPNVIKPDQPKPALPTGEDLR